jgi:hypothetical protein
MNRPLLLVPVSLLLLVGCQPPEIDAFRQRPVPIVVRLEVPASIPGADAIGQEYAAALRSRLATRTTVVVDGAAPPAAAADLRLVVTDIRRSSGEPSAAAVGVATGLAVGTLNAVLGNRNAAWEGVYWGLWTGTNVAAAQHAERRSLGYRPNRINAVAYLTQKDASAPGKVVTLAEFDVSGQEVVESMMPLSPAERDDPPRVREEEARALARVVVRKLEDRFGWTAKSQPDFYGPRKEVDPEPQKRDGGDKPPAPEAKTQRP